MNYRIIFVCEEYCTACDGSKHAVAALQTNCGEDIETLCRECLENIDDVFAVYQIDRKDVTWDWDF